ncbi:23 kDa jasmonate-induced protein-like [Rutidosis leptorrhynchoides]|uniref:23 kDa jasmonate-induced protein-like n=1 Tax=Rutidosis leptorrhynchoides TaxID=125765 RepID=UPI003A996648
MSTPKNVFGEPVTEGSRLERARNALNNPNEGGKHDAALAFIRDAKKESGDGVSTLCIFYNASGVSLLFAQQDSSYGKFYTSVPDRVQNGQWGAFLHTKKSAEASGSVGLVVYRFRLNDADHAKLFFSWETPWGLYKNKAYCDVVDDNANINPSDIYGKMYEKDAKQYSVTKDGMYANAKIEYGTSPLYEAKLTMEDAA